VVAEENMALEGTSDEEEFMLHVSTVYQTKASTTCHATLVLALSDTCYAKTVCGEAWMQKFMKKMWQQGIEFFCLPEEHAFHFGAGPRICSSYCVVFPSKLGTTDAKVYLRVSVVPVEVPLLVSRLALEELGAVLHIPAGKVYFKKTGKHEALHTTTSGHIGFNIFDEKNGDQDVQGIWEELEKIEKEVILLKLPTTRTKGCEGSVLFPSVTPEPVDDATREYEHDQIPWDVNVTACLSVHPVDQQDQPSTTSTAHSNQAVCGSGVYAGTQVEGRVCFGHRSSILSGEKRFEQAHHGSSEGNLVNGQTGQDPCPSSQLEEVRFAKSQELIPGHVPRDIRSSSGWALDQVATSSVDHRARDVGGRDEGGDSAEGTDSQSRAGTSVPQVRNPMHSPHQSGNQGALLGLHSLPRVSADHADAGCRFRDQEDCEGDQRKEEGRGRGSGEVSSSTTQMVSCKCSRVRRILDACSFRWIGSRGDIPGQCELEPRGDGDDRIPSCRRRCAWPQCTPFSL